MEQQLIMLIGAAVFVVIVFLVVIVFMQQNKLKRLEEPRYGFLGKPIASLITAAVLGAGLIGGVYLVNQDETTFQTDAKLSVKVSYTKQLVADNGATATYQFRANPTVSGEETTNTTLKEFNVYWNFVGPQKYSKSEIHVSEQNPSNIQITLRKGTYDVIILVNYTDKQSGRTFSETLKETIVI